MRRAPRHTLAPPRRWLRRRSADGERGSVLVAVAVLMPLLLGILVLVVDFGHAFMVQRHLQSAADAAALAAAQELPDMANAEAVANDYSASSGGRNERSNVPGVTTTVSFPDPAGDRVRVRESAKAGVVFAGIFGFDGFDVSAVAVASAIEEPSEGNYLIYSHSPECGGDGLQLNGNGITALGAVRSNGRLGINGEDIQLDQVSGYGPNDCEPVVGTSGDSDPASVDDVIEDNSLVDWPIYFSYPSDFPPGYCPEVKQKYDLNNSTIQNNRVYCAREEFKFSGDPNPGVTYRITVLAPKIIISGNGNSFKYYDEDRELLFFATGTDPSTSTDTPPCPSGTHEVTVNAGSTAIEGYLFNPCGLLRMNGDAGSSYKGFLVANTVIVNGNDFTMDGTGPAPSGGGKRIVSLIE
jgi:hypothetical protein